MEGGLALGGTDEESSLAVPMAAMSWDAWAHEDRVLWHIGEKRWVELHGLDLPIVEVRVTLNPEGRYWGWQYAGKESELPEMVWPEGFMLRMCFPYGFEIEEKRGKGRHVRLNIVKKED